MSHPFFAGIDWLAIRNKQVTPPFKPTMNVLESTKPVRGWSEKDKAKLATITVSSSEQARFKGIPFVSQKAVYKEAIQNMALREYVEDCMAAGDTSGIASGFSTPGTTSGASTPTMPRSGAASPVRAMHHAGSVGVMIGPSSAAPSTVMMKRIASMPAAARTISPGSGGISAVAHVTTDVHSGVVGTMTPSGSPAHAAGGHGGVSFAGPAYTSTGVVAGSATITTAGSFRHVAGSSIAAAAGTHIITGEPSTGKPIIVADGSSASAAIGLHAHAGSFRAPAGTSGAAAVIAAEAARTAAPLSRLPSSLSSRKVPASAAALPASGARYHGRHRGGGASGDPAAPGKCAIQ